MFTGIVEEVGEVRAVTSSGSVARLKVACRTVIEGSAVGDSISVNGCCVTVTALPAGGFEADLMGETLARTALWGLDNGTRVNLERPLRNDGRLGGHLVQGHVDGVGQVVELAELGEWSRLTCRLPESLGRYVAEKGSIAVNGVSLTITAVAEDHFSVGLVPHTMSATALSDLSPGDPVNIEVDIVAKYVERLIGAGVATPYSVERHDHD